MLQLWQKSHMPLASSVAVQRHVLNTFDLVRSVRDKVGADQELSGQSVVQLSVAVQPGAAHAVCSVFCQRLTLSSLSAADCDLQAQCDKATGKCVHIPNDAACTSSSKSYQATKIPKQESENADMLLAKLLWELYTWLCCMLASSCLSH